MSGSERYCVVGMGGIMRAVTWLFPIESYLKGGRDEAKAGHPR